MKEYVEIDNIVCNYLENCNDRCINEKFSRLVKSDGEFTVLFPFKALFHSFILGGLDIEFDPQKEKDYNNNMRLLIRNIKAEVLKYFNEGNELSKNGKLIII